MRAPGTGAPSAHAARSVSCLLFTALGCAPTDEPVAKACPELAPLWTLTQGDGGLSGLGDPAGVAFGPDGLIYVANADGSGLAAFHPDGTPAGPAVTAPASTALVRSGDGLVSAGPDGLVRWQLAAGGTGGALPAKLVAGPVTDLWSDGDVLLASRPDGVVRLELETLATAEALPGVVVERLGGRVSAAGVEFVGATADGVVWGQLGADARVLGTTPLEAVDGVALSPGGLVAATAGCNDQNVYLFTPTRCGAEPGCTPTLGLATPLLPVGVVAECPGTTNHPQWGEAVDWEEFVFDAHPERVFPSALAFQDDDTLVVTARHGQSVSFLRREGASWRLAETFQEAPPALLYELGPRDYFGPFRPYAELRGAAAVTLSGTRVAVVSQVANTLRVLDGAAELAHRQAGEGGVEGLAGAYTLALGGADRASVLVAGRLDDGLGVFRRSGASFTEAPRWIPAPPLPCPAGSACPPRRQMLRVSAAHAGPVVFANDYGPPGVHAFRDESGGLVHLASAEIPTCALGNPKPVLTDVIASPDDRFIYVSDFQREGSTSCVWQLSWDGESRLGVPVARRDPELAGVESMLIPRDGRSMLTTSYVASGLAVLPRDEATGALGPPTLFADERYYGVEFIVMTRDERTLYVTNPVQGTLLTIARVDGALSLQGVISTEGGTPMLDVAGVALSPSEELLAATNRVRGSLTLYQRDTGSGALTWLANVTAPSLAFANGVAFSPAGDAVFVAAAHAFTLTGWSVPCVSR